MCVGNLLPRSGSTIRILGALAMAMSASMNTPAAAQDAIANFYKGKQLKLIVGSEAGGGYDFYGRLLARHFGRFVPGNPTVVVFNQVGAGSIIAINAVYVTQPQDGTVIGMAQSGASFEQIFGHEGPQFEAAKIRWLGSLNSEAGIGLTYNSKVKKFDDLMTYESIWGTSGSNLTQQYPSMLTHMFGAKIRQVARYPSVVEAYGAMERGETDAVATQWASIARRYPDWWPQHKANFLVQFSLVQQVELQGVPMILDLLTEQNLTPGFKPQEAEAIWRIMLIQLAMARPFFVGPGVPDTRLAALRKAFDEMAVDKEFLADAAKSKLDIYALNGEALQAMMTSAATTPRSTLDKVAEATRP